MKPKRGVRNRCPGAIHCRGGQKEDVGKRRERAEPVSDDIIGRFPRRGRPAKILAAPTGPEGTQYS